MANFIDIETGGVSRQTNPTPVKDGGRAVPSYDDVGRALTTPYQVRDLVATARASITGATETELFAGASDTFHDLVQVTGSNDSTNAVGVSIKDATGGGTVLNLELPANDTKTFVFPVPYPQNAKADTWTVTVDDFVDDGDTSNGTVVVTGLFIKNI